MEELSVHWFSEFTQKHLKNEMTMTLLIRETKFVCVKLLELLPDLSDKP